jgi:CRISPR/Cas system CMR subunit Cmr6 (Cas7 group RAMP superfamily)
MKHDWYANMVERYHEGLRRSRSLTEQLPALGWYDFFEESSLYTTYAEATSGPKQKLRDVYTREVAPEPDRSYGVSDRGVGLVQRLSLDVTKESLVAGLKQLPPYSWGLCFQFTLAKPYLSKDEAPFYVIDNPVRKDKVFKLPMVAATTWKGNLRAVLRQEKGIVREAAEREHGTLTRLFGNVKGEEAQEAFRAGRLRFFPTFFTQIGLEVINPHSRESGAGEQPIYLECVPRGASGTFVLLYVPFDLLGKSQQKARAEAASDLNTALGSVRAMMRRYGFGAKTASGFGVAGDQLSQGSLGINLGTQTVPLPVHSFRELTALASALAEKIQPGGAQ